jgi:hypothetical protein
MKMGLKRYGLIALIAMVALTLAPQAFATAQLKISDNAGNSVFITDNGGAGTCVGILPADCVDKNGAVNVVTFIGVIGTWTLNVSTGSSHGASAGTDMDLNSANSTSAASVLTIQFSDDGFPTPEAHTFTVGGTLQGPGSITFTNFAGTNRFDQTNPIGSPLTFGPGAFSGSTGSGVIAGGALTEVAVLTFTGAGSTSFNGALTPVPEPASVALFGGVLLLSVGAIRRKMGRV